VLAAVGWGRRRRGVRVQCLPTLLLPGTDLRERAAQWGLVAPPRPPYGVLSTPTLSRDAMLRIEAFLSATPGLPADSPTARFVGNVLPGLFVERHAIVLPRAADRAGVPGTANRRTLMLRGSDLFACRREIRGILRRVVNREPDCLWQFVLCPEREEPLDTLDLMLRELRRAPAHWLDRSAGPRLSGRMAARRIMVLLRRGQRYDRAWRRAAESFLRRSFY
jgi:hypothetical protein